MAKTTTYKLNKVIREKVLQFGKILEADGIPVKKLVVFGSYAKNNATKYSDIDVCVVSTKFGKDIMDELQFLFKERRKVDSRIEPYPASPKTFKELESPLMWEINKYGVDVLMKQKINV